jgi:hypothetical protein
MKYLFIILVSLAPAAAAGDDVRQAVDLPPMMQQHMMGNMRDHLAAISEIQAALGQGQFDQAAQIAESRIGMSSLVAHHAAHMAPYMPKGMQAIGTEMHHAASRFALTAAEADMPRAVAALSQVTRQCVACHAAYRLR